MPTAWGCQWITPSPQMMAASYLLLPQPVPQTSEAVLALRDILLQLK